LSAWISSAPYFDLNVTDIEHVALSLTDAMRTTPRLYVKYSCSDETKERIEEIVNKICLLSPNERKAISDEQSKRR
jgi:DNA polymerase II large subunit